LGKRNINTREDVDMDDVSSESNEGEMSKSIRGSLGKMKRNLTPLQRKITVQKILRDRSSSRREGSEP
jgi:hypothetical protein